MILEDNMENENQDEMRDKLLADLKKQLAGELKEELKKEIATSLKNDGKKDISAEQLKDNSAILSSTGRILVPKPILKALNWKKGDVLELSIDKGTLIAECVGHTDAKKKPKKKEDAAAPSDDGIPIIEGGDSKLNVMKFIEFEFEDRKILDKLTKVLDNAYKLYENNNFNDAFKLLDMINSFEINQEEPDRSKMRISVINFLSEVFSEFQEAMDKQLPETLEIVKKINSRYLREKAYSKLAIVSKRSETARPVFENILQELFDALDKYQDTEMYAIVSLVENLIELIIDIDSPYMDKMVEYLNDKFNITIDIDYKMRFIRFLAQLHHFNRARYLANSFKETTTEGSSERRMALDVLKEIRDAKSEYLDKYPEFKDEEIKKEKSEDSKDGREDDDGEEVEDDESSKDDDDEEKVEDIEEEDSSKNGDDDGEEVEDEDMEDEEGSKNGDDDGEESEENEKDEGGKKETEKDDVSDNDKKI